MTLAEALVFKSKNNFSPIELTLIDAGTVLEFSGMTPSDEWNPEDKELRCKFYNALLGYLDGDNIGVTSESEGGFSKSYDKLGKTNWLHSLALESGCLSLIERYDPTPTIQNKSNMW